MAKVDFSKLKKPYFIAEIGGNHSGNKNFALEGIVNAKNSGANCVKFQMYKSEKLVLKTMPVMQHVKSVSKDRFQYERFKKLEIKESDILEYYKLCKKIKIDLSVTPFFTDCVEFLSKYISFFKIASGDIDFFPMIELIAKFNKPVVVSTGMSSFKEIKEILKILKKNQVVLMHCISSYPTQEKDLNLNSFLMLKKFGKILGFSDHTKDKSGAILSLAYGAKVFEKHFLPNKKIKNVGDFKLSLNPIEMKEYIDSINKCSKAFGNVRKKYFLSEKPFFNSLRRSAYFVKNLKKNEVLERKHLVFLRPFSNKAIKNNEIKKVIGRKLKKNVKLNQTVIRKLFK